MAARRAGAGRRIAPRMDRRFRTTEFRCVCSKGVFRVKWWIESSLGKHGFYCPLCRTFHRIPGPVFSVEEQIQNEWREQAKELWSPEDRS
jgi:hypothetical protein